MHVLVSILAQIFWSNASRKSRLKRKKEGKKKRSGKADGRMEDMVPEG